MHVCCMCVTHYTKDFNLENDVFALLRQWDFNIQSNIREIAKLGDPQTNQAYYVNKIVDTRGLCLCLATTLLLYLSAENDIYLRHTLTGSWIRKSSSYSIH